MDDLHDVWLEYWTAYEQRQRLRVKQVAQQYPVRRGLEVSYTELLELGVPHEQFRYNPGLVLEAGVSAFGAFVRDSDIEDAWDREFSALVPYVIDLPDAFNVNQARHLEDHLNELVRLEVTVTSQPEVKADLIEAAFRCTDGHLTRVHQAHLHKQFIDTCGHADCAKSVYHEPNQSLFARIQRAYVSAEHFDDVMVILGGSENIYDDMSVEDTYKLHALVRAETSDETTHGDVHLAGLYTEPVSAIGY